MELNQIISNRYSVREYKPDSVSEKDLLKVLEAGRLAPSAVNLQPWYFIVINTEETLNKIKETYHRDWIKSAPTIIAICGDHQTSWKRTADGKDHCDIDIAIAIEHLCLQATELGLGTCWVCNFDPEKARAILKLPDHIEPVALLSIGYPKSEDVPAKKRKALNEIVFSNEFGKAFTR